MKTINFLALLLAGFVVIVSCTNRTANSQNTAGWHHHLTADTAFLCSADSAQRDIQYLQSLNDSEINERVFTNDFPTAFTVNAEDLLMAMGIAYDADKIGEHKNIRIYMGYRPKSEARGGFKLYIVPVSGISETETAGNDMVIEKTAKELCIVKPKPDGLNTQYVLDLNAPCPSTCDINSPFMPSKR
jgi:hypothetical protein